MDELNAIQGAINTGFEGDVLKAFQRKVITRSIVNSGSRASVLNVIDNLSNWATKLYEGRQIAATVGFREKGTNEIINSSFRRVSFSGLSQHDFSSVLSNGFDSMFVLDMTGDLIGHESLPCADQSLHFTPLRYSQIANWTVNGRIALSLNRLGEIFVFKDGKLVFVKRSGVWHYLTDEPIITQMGRCGSTDVKTSVYESCLDASFARTGACIGLIYSGERANSYQIVSKDQDRLRGGSTKAIALRRMINNRKFHELDRRLRMELLAIDGATLIGHDGTILVVGAILNISGGSDGGGRLAASKALSKFGLGIKVSADGAIKGFERGELRFQVM